ncbi:MAG TPA: addiction module protein [Thermoanaerobaculia bacterium]|nr:addiction module protein [Thermoanaerobaculia bacterium]
MGRKLEEITVEVMQLDLDSRAALAKQLLDSLEEISEEENERLWTEEAIRRYREIKQGLVETIPAAEVFSEIRARRS